MKTPANRLLRTLWIVVCLFPLTACATMLSTPLEGQVLEHGTNKPIPNAIVVGRWDKTYPGIVHSSTACVHVETATSDAQGNFRLPSYKGETPDHLDVYRPGYEHFLPSATAPHVPVYVKPFTGSKGERFQSLWRIFSSTNCHAAGRSAKNLFPLYKAAYEESKPLAATEEGKRLLQIMRELAASAWLAEDGSRTTSDEQKLIKEYLRDHLP